METVLTGVAKKVVRHLDGREKLEPVQVTQRKNRVVKVYPGGLRTVTEDYGDGGEAWYRTVIMPRELALEVQRQIRASGVRRPEKLSLVPFIGGEYYGGPGRGFANQPHIVRGSRKWIIAKQRGGLDI